MNPSLLLIPDRYKKDKLYSQIPDSGAGDLTFARNSNATRVNSAGLIEKVRENLILYSEQFDDAYWSKTNSTITANSATAPDGTLTADKLVENALLGQHSVARVGGMTAAGVYALSVFVKAAERTRIAIGNSSAGDYAIFDLSLGTVVQASTGTVTNGKISSIDANGYYRVSCTITVAAPASAQIALVSTGTTTTYLGDGTSGLFLWGAQLETGDIATDYIPTTTAAVSVGITADIPRLDYTGGGCPSLLLEPQRTNSQTHSEDFSQAKYTKTQCTISANVTATLDPAGLNGSDKLVENVSVAEQHFVFFTAQTGVNEETQISIFAKAGGRTQFLLWESAITNAQAIFNLSTGTISGISSGNAANLVTTTPTITEYENGWYRCTLNYKTASGGGTIRVQLYNGSTSYNGNGTDGIFLYGLQEEVNVAYATSYIPTLGSSVTRLADAASKTGISSLIGQTEGTVFISVNQIISTGAGGDFCSIDDGTQNNRIHFLQTATNFYGLFAAANNVTQTLFTSTVSPSGNDKLAFSYKNNLLKIFINGVLIHTDTSFTVPATTAFRVNNRFDNAFGVGIMNCTSAAVYPVALSDAEILTLTAL